MTFSFHAQQVAVMDANLYVGFADREENGEHYFEMTREEESPQALPHMKNVYIVVRTPYSNLYGRV